MGEELFVAVAVGDGGEAAAPVCYGFGFVDLEGKRQQKSCTWRYVLLSITSWALWAKEGGLAFVARAANDGICSDACGRCVVDLLKLFILPISKASALRGVCGGSGGGAGWTSAIKRRSVTSPCLELRRLVIFVRTGCEFHLWTGWASGARGVDRR